VQSPGIGRNGSDARPWPRPSFGSPLLCAIIATLHDSFYPATVRCSFRVSMLQWAVSAGRCEGAKAVKAVPFPGVAAHLISYASYDAGGPS
jgi:hypothetical protein